MSVPMSAPAPRISSTSLPVRQTQPEGDATEQAPRQRRPRQPRAVAGAALPRVEPDPELLEELGRLFWNATAEGASAEEAIGRVMDSLRRAKKLGEIATLLGVE